MILSPNWALSLVLFLILLGLTAGLFVAKEVGYFKVRRAPENSDDWGFLQSSAVGALTFWLGSIASLIAILSLDYVKGNSENEAIVLALIYCVFLSGIPALVPLGANLFVSIKDTSRANLITKSLATGWLLLIICLLEIIVSLAKIVGVFG